MLYRETKIKHYAGMGESNVTRIFHFNIIKSILMSMQATKDIKIPPVWAVNENPDEYSHGNEANSINISVQKMVRFMDRTMSNIEECTEKIVKEGNLS